MQIVIDIDDNLYTRLFDNGVDNYDDAAEMAKAIHKGKPLPKGHGRLIDADKFINDFACCGYIEDMDVDYFRIVVPTIIEADNEESEDKE